MSRWLRGFGAGLMALAILLAAPVPAELAHLGQAEVAPEGGEVLYVRSGDLWSYRVSTNEHRLFLHVPGGLVSHVAHAPDRQQLVYSVTYYDQAFNPRTSDIVLCDPQCVNPQVVVHEDEPGFQVGWASWPSDPGRLVYAKLNFARGVERVEEVDLATGERSLVLDVGSTPFASPTEPHLAYQTRTGQRWDIRSLDRQTGTSAELVPVDWFDDADHPAYSPDGGTVAFVAAGAGPTSRIEPTNTTWVADLFDLGRPRVAAAHDLVGVLFDLWVMQSNGVGLRRVAQLLDLQPEIAWSPSGRQVAAIGAFQLQIVDLTAWATMPVARPPAASPRGNPLSWGTGS